MFEAQIKAGKFIVCTSAATKDAAIEAACYVAEDMAFQYFWFRQI